MTSIMYTNQDHIRPSAVVRPRTVARVKARTVAMVNPNYCPGLKARQWLGLGQVMVRPRVVVRVRIYAVARVKARAVARVKARTVARLGSGDG